MQKQKSQFTFALNKNGQMENLIKIIQENSLTVRCLPHKVVQHWTYKEGDENVIAVDSKGNRIIDKRSVITDNKGRKMLRIEKNVDKGGWWYVKETKNTDSTVIFNRKYDTFFAPTLEGAIELYLQSKK